ncbi:MAG: M20/M25/M40 family metallo-hydrolase [Nitrospiraceae bacterium]|nr:M20/M25/M40 family metallo-hydrolase [Nitrospiraceae bacterium]
MFDDSEVEDNLYRHVDRLSVRIGERHRWKEGSLDRTADYIEEVLADSGYGVSRQTFTAYGRAVSNLIAGEPGSREEIVVVGAHYDTVPGSPGADDNASAVAGLLELARLCKGEAPRKRLVFAFFVNEEPPCFGSANMGSMVHAKSLSANGAAVEVMICLEMIGYFDAGGIQRYPFKGMQLIYPKTADFLAVIGNFKSSGYVSLIKRKIRKNADMRVRSLIAPAQTAGISHSDHSAFWQYGFRAVMVTDTAYFRNRNYHQETDTIDSLNFRVMTKVVKGLHRTILEI